VGGTYEIVDYLGRGAMGFVYRARHNILGREYALKTLGADQISDTSWRRFQIEAQAIAKMSHPNVVGIHNFALHHREGKADIPFYVMDLLEGSNLMERSCATTALRPYRSYWRFFSRPPPALAMPILRA
jgi:serine/threonine protein kinase